MEDVLCTIDSNLHKEPETLHKYDIHLSNDEDVQCDAADIRELCESRDSCDDLMFDHSELHIFIETLCTL